MSNEIEQCECGSFNLYARDLNANTGQGPNFLAGLGSFLRYAQFCVVVCGDCGLTRLYADKASREKLPESPKWQSLNRVMAAS